MITFTFERHHVLDFVAHQHVHPLKTDYETLSYCFGAPNIGPDWNGTNGLSPYGATVEWHIKFSNGSSAIIQDRGHNYTQYSKIEYTVRVNTQKAMYNVTEVISEAAVSVSDRNFDRDLDSKLLAQLKQAKDRKLIDDLHFYGSKLEQTAVKIYFAQETPIPARKKLVNHIAGAYRKHIEVAPTFDNQYYSATFWLPYPVS